VSSTGCVLIDQICHFVLVYLEDGDSGQGSVSARICEDFGNFVRYHAQVSWLELSVSL